MAKAKSAWTTVEIKPLSGGLDTRSRPADLPPGWFRNKLNFEITPTGQLKRRGGFERFYSDSLVSPYPNYDHRHQSATREPIVFMQETTGSDGVRRLFDGTQSRLSYLTESDGNWIDILTGLGAPGSRWKLAVLQDIAVISNGVDNVYQHSLGTGSAGTIPQLGSLGVSAARVVVEFNGFVFLMNFTQSGTPRKTRVRWSDLNLPLSWTVGSPSLAGFQDLDYGDEILAAAPLFGSLFIFTRRSIWRVNVNPGADPVIQFTRVYNEPLTQKGCLVYPQTLVSDGSYFFYGSRDAIYRFSPFVAAPERGDEKGSAWGDWLYRATGAIFSSADTLLRGNDCASPCAVFHPITNELIISWPALGSIVNTHTMIAQTQQQAADLVDHGYTALVNFRRTATSEKCNERQDLLGVSSRDWAIKSLGEVFMREFVTLTDPIDPTVDIPIDAEYVIEGYASQLRGLIPLGLTDRDKRLREVVVDADAVAQDQPCRLRCRIGNSHVLADPNNISDVCSPQWRDLGTIPLACPNGQTISSLTAQHLRPAKPMSFNCYVRGRFLAFELTIENGNGGLAIGGDAAFSRFDFDASPLPKP